MEKGTVHEYCVLLDKMFSTEIWINSFETVLTKWVNSSGIEQLSKYMPNGETQASQYQSGMLEISKRLKLDGPWGNGLDFETKV